MKLFKVSTKRYQDYYVLANNYDSAVEKVQNYKEKEVKCLIGSDGSLNIPCDDEKIINRVELLTDSLIK
jgi:tRNA isopentenyl-2-thiomethyl-A-37 hydroxylase MiaE